MSHYIVTPCSPQIGLPACMKCGMTISDAPNHICSQSRLHHDDLPGAIIDDGSEIPWQKIAVPKEYLEKITPKAFICSSCKGTFGRQWREVSGLCISCDIEKELIDGGQPS